MPEDIKSIEDFDKNVEREENKKFLNNLNYLFRLPFIEGNLLDNYEKILIKYSSDESLYETSGAKINSSKEKIIEKLSEFYESVKSQEKKLLQVIDDNKKAVDTVRKNNDKINVTDLIEFSQRISFSSSIEAPLNWNINNPLRPYPVEVEMKSGHLRTQ